MTHEEQRIIALKHIERAIERLKTVCKTSVNTEFDRYLKTEYSLEAHKTLDLASELGLITLDECRKYDNLLTRLRDSQ